MSDQTAIEAAAAEWLMRRSEPDWSDEHEETFNVWLEASFGHAAAFWRLEHGYAQLDRLLSLPPQPAAESLGQRPRLKRKYLAIAASIVALVCASWAIFGRMAPDRMAQTVAFSTEPGHISQVDLVDGTRISLDSGSAIRVSLAGRHRRVWLDRGRAFFDVAHAADRPFHVDAGIGQITVLGTSFVVARDRGEVTASVLRGAVQLEPADHTRASRLTLTRGDTGIVNKGAIRAVHGDPEKLQDSIAWRDGMMIFDDTPVAEAIAGLNRYNRRKLVLTDRGAGQTRIGGKFRLDNIDGFARLMDKTYGLEIEIRDEAREYPQRSTGR